MRKTKSLKKKALIFEKDPLVILLVETIGIDNNHYTPVAQIQQTQILVRKDTPAICIETIAFERCTFVLAKILTTKGAYYAGTAYLAPEADQKLHRVKTLRHIAGVFSKLNEQFNPLRILFGADLNQSPEKPKSKPEGAALEYLGKILRHHPTQLPIFSPICG